MKSLSCCALAWLFLSLLVVVSLSGGEMRIQPRVVGTNAVSLTFDCATDAYYQILAAGSLKSGAWAVTNMGLGSLSQASWTGSFPQASLYLRVRAVPQSAPRDEDADGMPDNWECQYGLNPIHDDSLEDADQDGFNNLEEYQAIPRTNPTNSISVPSGAIYVSTCGAANADGSYTNPLASIAAGITQATNGMRVILFPGIYRGVANKDLDFGGKSIGVKGLKGASHTIIDCEGAGRGFYFHNGETRAAVVEGITIRNGAQPVEDGGGILCQSSSPTIRHCLIVSNRLSSPWSAGASGGGIACVDGAAPLITNCTISYNHARLGGGIGCLNGAAPLITDCAIVNNDAGGGGGICCDESSPTVEKCRISDNEAGYSGDENSSGGGGGLCLAGSSLMIKNCIIKGNRSMYRRGGGLITKPYAAATVVNCTILNNGYFGLVGDDHSDLRVVNCILWDNWEICWTQDIWNGTG